MKKRIALLLLLLSPFIVCAMEDNSSSSFASCYTYIPLWFASESTTPLQDLQASKSEFEVRLKLGWSLQDWMSITLGSFSRRAIHDNPTEFLRYCYNLKLHNDPIGFELSDLDKDASLLNKCKEVQIDGYSALGVAIIAKDASVIVNKCILVSIKPRFILQLLNKGFTLSEKDRTLVALEFFDNISAEQKKTMISLLNDKQEDNFSVLPHDVRRLIVDYMVSLFKKEHWLCVLLPSVL